MNPEIEKIMELEQNEHMLLETRKETDVSNEEMAQHWKSFRKNIKHKHKYEKPLEENNELLPKPKFLKPQD